MRGTALRFKHKAWSPAATLKSHILPRWGHPGKKLQKPRELLKYRSFQRQILNVKTSTVIEASQKLHCVNNTWLLKLLAAFGFLIWFCHFVSSVSKNPNAVGQPAARQAGREKLGSTALGLQLNHLHWKLSFMEKSKLYSWDFSACYAAFCWIEHIQKSSRCLTCLQID